MRRLLVLVAACAAVTAVACERDDAARTQTPLPVPTGSVLVETDAVARDLDVAELAPTGTDVTGRWFGTVGDADVIVVAIAGEGDAFSRDRALWRWTYRSDLRAWLGLEFVAFPARRGVLSLDAVVRDVTADGNDDALVFASTGGSGSCGSWTVLDLTTGERIFGRELCDASVDPNSDPVGLVITESVYRPGDPHCCPSARRETVLSYAGGGDWDVERRETTSF